MTYKGIAAALAAAWTMATAAAVTPGVWNDDFTGSLAYATTNNLPIAVVWGNTSCHYCNNLAEAIETDTVKNWVAKHKVVLVHKHVATSQTKEADYVAAKNWIKDINSNLEDYPFVGMWWKKADGTETKVAFTGRTGMMPATEPKKDLAGQFAATLERYFGESTGGGTTPATPTTPTNSTETATSGDAYFTVGGTTYDRLEAEPSTTSVAVPIARKTSTNGAVNTLEILHPGAKAAETANIVWTAGESNKLVDVALPSTKRAGKQTVLTLKDADGKTLATSTITYVATQANAVTNPKFVGESFGWGEWTLDYAAAKAKGGYTLAVFNGTLWCPFCYGIEHSLFASSKFKSWAKSNKVALAMFDQSKASSPATAAGSGQARLLSYTAGDSSTLGGKASGASYLSRKGISQSAAQAVIDETTRRTVQWLAPGSTAARTSQPTLLLVKNDKVVGRLATSRDAQRYYDPAENIARLDDLLLLAERSGEEDDYPSTTTRTIAPGETARATFQINDRYECFRIKGATGQVAAAAKGARDVTLEILSGTNVLASGKNGVTADLKGVSDAVLRATGAMPELLGGKSSVFEATIAFTEGDGSDLIETDNPYYGTALKAGVALLDADGALAGTLDISATKAGRVAAKLYGLDGKTVSYSGKWTNFDSYTGIATATLAKKNAASLEISLLPDGTVEAAAGDAAGVASVEGDIKAFDGKYTVTLPVAETTATRRCDGAGWLSLTLKNGKATAKGELPDGTAVSASARFSIDPDDPEYAIVPLLRHTKKDTLALVLRVRANGAELYTDEQQLRLVRAAEGAAQLWIRHASGDAFETAFDVYGGWFATGKTVAQWLALYGLSEAAPAVDGIETAGKYSYSKTTGKINGTLKNVTLADGTFVTSGKFAGVLMPGWVDCGCGEEEYPGQYIERPFASGSFRYTVKEGTKKITVSVPFDLIAK